MKRFTLLQLFFNLILVFHSNTNFAYTSKIQNYKPAIGTFGEMYVAYPNDWTAADKRPVIILVHGGAWVSGDYGAFTSTGWCQYFADKGMVAISINYRLDSIAHAVMDCRSAIRYIKGHAALFGIDTNKVVAGGQSAGGHLSSCMYIAKGLDDPSDDLSISPIPQLFTFVDGALELNGGRIAQVAAVVGATLAARCQPADNIGSDVPPTLHLYGGIDGYRMTGHTWLDKARAYGVRQDFWIAPGCDHGVPFKHAEWNQNCIYLVHKFLTEYGYVTGEPTATLPTTIPVMYQQTFGGGITELIAPTAVLCVPSNNTAQDMVNMINGSGFVENPVVQNSKADYVTANSWRSWSPYQGNVIYDFGKNVDLNMIHLWNYDDAVRAAYMGIDSAMISVSSVNDTAAANFTNIGVYHFYSGGRFCQNYSLVASNVRLIKFKILKNFASGYVGLSELRFSNYTGANVYATHVTLDKSNVKINLSGTSQLTATVYPSSASNKNVTWSSDNTAVATVSATGLITAVGNGTATIKVTTADGSHTSTCFVTAGSSSDTQAPTAPSGLASSSITSRTFKLSWTGSTDNVGVVSYEVYRGTTFCGSTSSTSYYLTELAASTTYSMTVKAKDAAGNYSPASTALSVITNSVTKYEAENAVVSGGSVASSETGYSGTGYWGAGAANSYIEFTVTANAGLQAIYFNYSSGFGAPGSMSLYVNGVKIGRSSFAVTGGWNKWAEHVDNVTLVAGTNVIRYQRDAGDASAVNYDYLVVDNVVSSDVTAPTAPSALVSSAITATGFTLSWTAATDNVAVTSYEVFRGTTSCGTTATTSLNITGLTASTAYSLTVKAKDAAGNVSAASNALSVTTIASSDVTAPTAPSALVSSAITATGFTLSWTAATDNVAVTSYEVFRGTTSCGTTATTSLNITGLTASTDYSLTVQAKDAAGNVSAASSALSVTTIAAADITAPSAPTGLVSSAITATGFTLSWTAATDNLDVVSYEVFRGTTSCGTTASTTLNVTGLTASTAYSITVKAKDAAGNVSVASHALNVNTTNELALENKITSVTLYPNPVSSIVRISGAENGSLLSVVNMNGLTILDKICMSNCIELNVADLPAGIYFVRILESNKVIINRIIKE